MGTSEKQPCMALGLDGASADEENQQSASAVILSDPQPAFVRVEEAKGIWDHTAISQSTF